MHINRTISGWRRGIETRKVGDKEEEEKGEEGKEEERRRRRRSLFNVLGC